MCAMHERIAAGKPVLDGDEPVVACLNGAKHKINSHRRERDEHDGHGLYELDEFCSRCGSRLSTGGDS